MTALTSGSVISQRGMTGSSWPPPESIPSRTALAKLAGL
jgi:hypothetical protein